MYAQPGTLAPVDCSTCVISISPATVCRILLFPLPAALRRSSEHRYHRDPDLIENRFGLMHQTQHDATQPDISTMFDFANAPNMNPPQPHSQPRSGPCYVNALP